MNSVGLDSSTGSYGVCSFVPASKIPIKTSDKNAESPSETYPSLAKTSLKVKDAILLILCADSSFATDTMGIAGEAVTHPTQPFNGYVKRSDGDWSKCMALYVSYPLLTPESSQKAFDSKGVIKTYEYKAFFPKGSNIQYKTIPLEKVSFVSNEVFTKILPRDRTSTEMDSILQGLEI